MRTKFAFIALAIALLAPLAAHAQGFTKSTLSSQIGQDFPDNTANLINPAILRGFLNNTVNSFQQYAGVNAQVGTTYTIALSDYGQLVTFNNAGAVAVTLPQTIAGSNTFFPFSFYAKNLGTGTATITPGAGSTINGASSYALAQNQGAFVISDGTNYQVWGALFGTTVPWANITGTPTTLLGYGITNARTALAANATYYVNGNSAVTTATTAAGNAVLHFAQGSGTTNNTTAAGNNVLHFAAVPVTIYVGATITDSTASVIPAATTVTAVTATTVTISNNATGGGVGNGDTIKWSLSTFFVGQQITDSTASVIPALTTISSIAFSTTTDVTISANVTGAGVGNGDTIKWQAACGTTGASTCGYGLDTNNGTAPATPFLTAQAAINAIINTIDLNGFTATVSLAHGATTNYSATCTNGPIVGQSTFSIVGDSNAATAVGVVVNSSGGAFQVKDLCTPTLQNMSFYDRPTNNGSSFISVGTGAAGHLDGLGLTFNSMTIGTFVTANYSGATVTFTGAGNAITGGANAAFSVSAGATIDFSGITNAFTVTNNLAWTTGFAVEQTGGQFSGLVALGATGTFGNPTGHTGPRFFSSGPMNFAGLDPNSLFPGADAVASTIVGAVGVQSGSGASAVAAYGTSGQCLTSGGSSSAKNTWTNCAGAGVPQNNLNTQSGNYTIQTTDCGNTINATGAMKTITLPSVAGFATNCVLAVYNASSTRGQLLSGFPGAVSASPTNVLWSLDTITVEIVNGAWSIQSYVTRHKLTASTTVFVDNANGNDANDCLAATTSACKTIQGAINYVATWDGNTQAVTVSVADGTYTNAVSVNGPFHGNPTVTLQGDLATPANALISTTSANAIALTNGAALTLGGFKIVTTTSGNALDVTNASFLNVTGAMEFGASAHFHMRAVSAATITLSANYTISGNATTHWVASNSAVIQTSGTPTITLSGTPAFTTFTVAASGSTITSGAATFSGSATGSQYSISLGSALNNNGALPGSTVGTVLSGGHVATPGTPGVSSCGGSPGAATGSDFSGHVVEGSTATGCTITFTTATSFNSCTVSLSTGAAVGVSTLGATLVVVHASLSGNTLYWTCAN